MLEDGTFMKDFLSKNDIIREKFMIIFSNPQLNKGGCLF